MGGTEQLEDVGYLQDIISYIFDEKKIVTYKWISNIFAIHVNRAKQLLYTFIKHVSEEKFKDLKIVYLVGGILPDNKGCHLQVVSEEDKEKVKAQFEVITSEHIYSVCLKNCLSDLHNLCTIDGVKDSKVTRNGAVRYTKGVPRASEDVILKRQGAFKAVDEDKKWPAEQQKQSSAGNNGKKTSKAASSISSMFSAPKNKEKVEDVQKNKEKKEDSVKTKKPDEEQKEKTTTSPEKKVPISKNGPKGGKPPVGRLAAMFSAQNAKPKPVKKDNQEESKSTTEKDTSKKDTKLPENDVKSDEEKESKSAGKKDSKLTEKEEKKSAKKDNKVVLEKTSKNSKAEKKKSKQKKRKASDNRDKKNKKRKRIVVLDESDSSSDDIFGSDEEETPPSPEPVIIDEEMEESTQVDSSKGTESLPPESPTKDHHGRKRRLVDKTYIDDEGYVVTKKVYEFERCSGSENEEKENEKSVESNISKKETEPTPKAVKTAQKPEKKNTQKKASPPEKKKQATLMNFFKPS